MSPKKSLTWVSIWVGTALIFSWGVFHYLGTGSGVEFLTCYVIEWSLSLDNLFVFLLIFNAFDVKPALQIRALKWGIIGAIIMRFGFIVIGITLVEAFKPVLYVFGFLLLYSAVRMIFMKDGKGDIGSNRIVRMVRKKFPMTKNFYDDKFFIRKRGSLIGTPMLLVLVAIESSDVMFAIDSIPAAFAITKDPLIIFAANLFAILGLRSLYFLLAHADKLFSKLKYGIAVILAFVGIKIIIEQLHIHIDIYLSLAVILFCLISSIVLSLISTRKTP